MKKEFHDFLRVGWGGGGSTTSSSSSLVDDPHIKKKSNERFAKNTLTFSQKRKKIYMMGEKTNNMHFCFHTVPLRVHALILWQANL